MPYSWRAVSLPPGGPARGSGPPGSRPLKPPRRAGRPARSRASASIRPSGTGPLMSMVPCGVSPTRWTEGRQIVGSGQESPPASSRQTLCFGQLRARRGSAPLRSPAPGRSRSAVLLFLSPQRLPRRAEPHDRGSLGVRLRQGAASRTDREIGPRIA